MSRKRMGGRELYARLYASAHDHPTTLAAGLEANGMQWRALSYTIDQQTDGHLPMGWVDLQGTPGKRACRRLAEVGWLVSTDAGYLISDFVDHNPSSDEIETRRASERARKSGGLPPGKTPEGSRKSSGVPPGRLARADGSCSESESGSEKGKTLESSTPVESADSTSQDHVRDLFAYWQSKCGHPQAKLTSDRRGKVKARIAEGYTPDQIRAAIDGAARAAHVNDQGHRFDDLELICRNGSKLESFIARTNGTGADPMSVEAILQAGLAA